MNRSLEENTYYIKLIDFIFGISLSEIVDVVKLEIVVVELFEKTFLTASNTANQHSKLLYIYHFYSVLHLIFFSVIRLMPSSLASINRCLDAIKRCLEEYALIELLFAFMISKSDTLKKAIEILKVETNFLDLYSKTFASGLNQNLEWQRFLEKGRDLLNRLENGIKSDFDEDF